MVLLTFNVLSARLDAAWAGVWVHCYVPLHGLMPPVNHQTYIGFYLM